MSFIFKSIQSTDVTITPFYANKLWEVGSTTIGNLLSPDDTYVDADISMSVYFGRKTITPWISTASEERTTHNQFTRNVWNSINNLFYREFNSKPLEYFKQGVDGSETRSISDTIQIFSIPQKVIGLGIDRGSFKLVTGGNTYTDDTNGNVMNGTTHVGNIIYNQGLVILTNSPGTSCTFSSLKFRSKKVITSNEVICVTGPGEHNMSTNPTLQQEEGVAYSFVTGSFFSPYVTSIGLYNDQGDLLLIGKLARPIKKALNCDTIFVVKWDSFS